MNKLYTMRYNGEAYIVEYENIKTNIYKDTSCNGHTNCEVKVEFLDNKYKITECINDSAKKHKYYHLNNNLFETKEECVRDYYNNKIDYEKKELVKAENELTDFKAKIKKLGDTTYTMPKLTDFDFGDKVYLCNGRANSKIFEFEVYFKLITKNGVEEIHSEDYEVTCDFECGMTIYGYNVKKKLNIL